MEELWRLSIIDEKTVLKYCFIETENRRVVSRAKERKGELLFASGRIPVLKDEKSSGGGHR